jgi:hypothetical protein
LFRGNYFCGWNGVLYVDRDRFFNLRLLLWYFDFGPNNSARHLLNPFFKRPFLFWQIDY